MKLPEPPPREEPENILPLVNVVFLLIIFFMLAGTFSNPDLFAVDPPESSSENPTGVAAPPILLSADGRLAYGGRRVTLGELQALIAKRVANGNGEVRPIKIKADAASDTQRLIEVMQRLQQAGAETVTLLTLAPDF